MAADRLDYAVSCVVGMFFGAFISLIVDSALFEIGKSPFFAAVFGICLIVIGGLILWRVAPEQGERMSRWRWLVFIFSCMVLTSGVCCFLVEKQWIKGLGPGIKLPMYTLLGTSLCFALSFSVVDLLNSNVFFCCKGFVGDVSALTLASQGAATRQVYVVLLASVLMGGVFGCSFGLLDVEDDSPSHRRFDQDQAINTILGALAGVAVGGASQYLRDKALVDAAPYVTIAHSAYDDDTEF
eukprot:Tamp_14914.p1 GENE.Tamp_14914~~Tamp_14914.p1  ORF type:complete len:240 (+),score=30.00 Tamp_14914:143-862(+)